LTLALRDPAVSNVRSVGAASGKAFSVVRYDGFAQLPPSYSGLFEAAAPSVFLSEQWFRNYAETVAGGGPRVSFYGVEDAESGLPAAVLPVCGPHKGPGPFAPRTVQGLANYYSALFGLVTTAEGARLDAVCGALARALWGERRDWDLIDLKPLDREAAWFAPFVRALREAGAVTQTYFCHGNWYLEVQGRSYTEYLAGLSSVLRKNIPYGTRRLERSGGRIVVLTEEGPGLEEGLRDYARVYGASWKIPEPYPHFMPGLARMAAREGWLRFGLAYVEGEPAAAQVWLVHRSTASIFKIAYDERFAKLSLGTVLTAHMMDHVMTRDQVRIVDYLSGDDEYKRNWMSHRRERHGLLAINPRSVRGAVQAARHVGGVLRRTVLASTGA